MKLPSLDQVIKATVESKCKQKASFSYFDITTCIREALSKKEVQIEGFSDGAGNVISHTLVRDIIKNQKLIPDTYKQKKVATKSVTYMLWTPIVTASSTMVNTDILDF